MKKLLILFFVLFFGQTALANPHLLLRLPANTNITREFYTQILARAGREYVPATTPYSPTVDPRSGGIRNNSDGLTNAVLAYMLYRDEVAFQSAINVAIYLVQTTECCQDNAHAQRHLAIPLVALLTENPELRAYLLTGFVESYGRIQNADILQNCTNNRCWIGSTLRPTIRAFGNAIRAAHVMYILQQEGLVGPLNSTWKTPDELKRVTMTRITEYMSFRKTEGDNQPRGWQTAPGEWTRGTPIRFWPLLTSRNIGGHAANEKWFHRGSLWGQEMLNIQIYGFSNQTLPLLFQLRTRELITHAMIMGYDYRLRYSMRARGDFWPGQTGQDFNGDGIWETPNLQAPMVSWPLSQRQSFGEREHSLAPNFYFVEASLAVKRRYFLEWVASTEAIRPGEVDAPTLFTAKLLFPEVFAEIISRHSK